MGEGSTTWKKKKRDQVQDFDVLKIKENVKKIKKRKSILPNTQFVTEPLENIYEQKDETTDKIIEGFEGGGDDDDDLDDLDPLFDLWSDVMEYFIQKIDTTTQTFDKFSERFASLFAGEFTIEKLSTPVEATEYEIALLRGHLGYFTALCMSTIATYNWFYIIYTKRLGGQTDNSPEDRTFELYQMEFYNKPFDWTKYNEWILYFFEFSFKVVGKTEYYVTRPFYWLYCYFGIREDYCFYILYATIFAFALNFSTTLKEFIFYTIDSSYVDKDTEKYKVPYYTNNMEGVQMLSGLVMAYVVIMYFGSFGRMSAEQQEKLKFDIMSRNLLALVSGVMRFVWILMINAPLGGLLAAIYLLVYSYGALFLYEGSNILANIELVEKSKLPHIPEPPMCDDDNVINTLIGLPDYIFRNLVLRGGVKFVFLLYFIFALFSYGGEGLADKISWTFCTHMVFICLTMIFCILINMPELDIWNKFIMKTYHWMRQNLIIGIPFLICSMIAFFYSFYAIIKKVVADEKIKKTVTVA